ncbi:MAG: primosomal protein N' [Firmicutes bacterium]|nr:primosomal protein N' [Bacillota bacterium]
MKYIQAALDNKAAATNILYTYACPDDGVRVGDAVRVPFGNGNRTRAGVVFRVSDTTEIDPAKLKSVAGRTEALLTEEDVHLCEEMKRRYLCRYTDAIRCFIPPGFRKFQDQLTIADPEEARAFLENPKSPRRQRELTEVLLQNGPALKSDLKRLFGIDYSVMAAAEKKGLVSRGAVEKQRRPHAAVLPDREGFDGLTAEQEAAFGQIRKAMEEERYRGFLIHGVTGSGKTRLYMEAVREALLKGKTAIVLVPEISLTIQAIEKFRGEFDPELVAVLHSRLSDGERFDEWQRIRRGDARIVLGARSAVFAPVKDLGVIVVDEEHESSYKADNPPKYDTREMAEERAKYNNAVLIMGSATPSVENYYRSETGELKRLELKKRYNEVLLPRVEIADMREELGRGNRSVFSVSLFRQIRESLDNRRQVILFLNRRGYASFVSCRNCGYVMTCPECGLSLTYHKAENAAVCHYCGRKFRVPRQCPECGSRYIKEFGTGTEKIEELTRKLFPEAKVARLDLDTTRQKGSAERILGAFKAKETDILIGTQLVAKGLDYDNVHLVGILAADISLHIPDNRAP